MAQRIWRACLLVAVVVGAAAVAVTASASADEPQPQAGGVDDVFTTDGLPINTYRRSQDEIATKLLDSNADGEIPSLPPTNYKKVWRSIPNLEHMSPFITSTIPMLPTVSAVTNALNVHFPLAWPLAGRDGSEKKDWLNTWFRVFSGAFLGRGPKPPVHFTVLIPTPEAYHKLAADVKAHSGLNMSAEHIDPVKAATMAAAIHHQLLTNLFVIAAPNLTTAVNGTVMMTHGKVKLTLLVKPDGSRSLVSNTTAVKIVKGDISCPRCGTWTYNLVDGFVVPKMSPTIPKPDPLITPEDLARWPLELKETALAIAAMPKAAWDMPGAMWGMLARQLPAEHQALLEQLSKALAPKLPKSPLSISIRRLPTPAPQP